ncbi:MAG: hypothetical protein A4E53_02165 [Pelotomaculum sp. PtaB.Bin104]|nr:MAG: hypothetical protein A4E53_02165 [Pelotomaculum sp. PtaB.Bin104]
MEKFVLDNDVKMLNDLDNSNIKHVRGVLIMPRVFPKNKFWLGSANLNQKRHADMTEEEKANVARCTGTKDEHPCKNPIYRCTVCGNYGCVQEIVNKCDQQGFKGEKCLHCGVTGNLVPVMVKELPKFIAEWEKEVPAVKF